MKYKPEDVKDVLQEFKKLPKKKESEKKLSIREVIEILLDEILILQDKGYSLEEVTEVLRKKGFKLTKNTLTTYLQRAKRKKRGKKKRRIAEKSKTSVETKQKTSYQTPSSKSIPSSKQDIKRIYEDRRKSITPRTEEKSKKDIPDHLQDDPDDI